MPAPGGFQLGQPVHGWTWVHASGIGLPVRYGETHQFLGFDGQPWLSLLIRFVNDLGGSVPKSRELWDGLAGRPDVWRRG